MLEVCVSIAVTRPPSVVTPSSTTGRCTPSRVVIARSAELPVELAANPSSLTAVPEALIVKLVPSTAVTMSFLPIDSTTTLPASPAASSAAWTSWVRFCTYRLDVVSAACTVTVTGAPPPTVLRLTWKLASADRRPTMAGTSFWATIFR